MRVLADCNGADRLWRARRTHAWIDAQLQAREDAASYELRIFFDGDLIFSRTWPTREAALAFASAQLRELQRVGWTTHW
jgi:hypothetical protein